MVAVLATALSFVRPLEYSSTVRLLIVPRQTLGLDPYVAIRTAERISENLASIIYTTSFFEKVLAEDADIDRNYFNVREYKKRRQWQRMIETQVSRGGGLLMIRVYHPNRDQAGKLITAVGNVLRSEGWTYVGGGDLPISIVDAPLTSRWPSRPNIPMNALAGFALGIIALAVYSAYDASRRHSSHSRGFLHEA